MAKRKKVIKKYSLINKIVSLTVFLDAIFLVLILASAVFLYYLNLSNTKEENADYENKIVTNILSDIFNSVKTDTHKLAIDTDITSYLKYINNDNQAIIDNTDSNYDIFSRYLVQTSSIIDYQENKLYDSVYLATDTGCSGGTDGCEITYDGQVSLPSWKLSEQPWFIEMAGNDTVLTHPYVNKITGNYIVSYVEKIFDGDSVIGYIGINIKLADLAILLNNDYASNIKDKNEILIFSDIENQPKLIYYTGEKYLDYYMQDSSSFFAIDQANGFDKGVNYVLTNYNTETTLFTKAFNNNVLIVYSDIEGTNYTVVTMFYNNQTYSIEIVFSILLVIASIIIVLIGLFMNGFIKKSLNPIDIILESIEEIKNGNYQVFVDVKENNEFKQIGDAINIMSSEIDHQIKKTYESLAYDVLTGLKNRASASAEVDSTIFKSNKRSAVCLIQVENLKNLNVTKGQMIGDNLIKAIADEFKQVLPTGEKLYSNGGNEFVYIKEHINSLETVKYTLNKFLFHFKTPIQVKNIKTEIKLFIGVSVYPTDGQTLDELIKKCNTALFKTNDKSHQRIIFYNEKIARSVSYQAEISEQLSQAILKEQLYMKYQPLITNNNEIYGFEALVRWNSPTLGEIGPQIFIANAEESSLIIPIGTWIFKEACLAQVKMREKYGKNYVMSVNVSPVQILQKDFVDIVKQIIKETDIDSKYLTIEITESVFIEATVILDDTIEQLHNLGVKLSLDDFGTGYASLTYLRQINFDNLKIDKTFVDGIFSSEKDHKIIGTIVNLVHDLDMKVIAEGVESKKQYEYLKQISTDIFQGFIFSKPLLLNDVYGFIDKFYKIARSKRADVFASLNE